MQWFVCDKNICLYSDRSMRRLKSDPCRCVKHGAILTYGCDSPTRDEAALELGFFAKGRKYCPECRGTGNTYNGGPGSSDWFKCVICRGTGKAA